MVKEKAKNKVEDAVLIAVFLILLLVPMTLFYLDIDPVPTVYENRILASYYPSENLIEAVANFPEEYEPYFSDHFGLKYFFVRISNFLNSRFIGHNTADFVIAGKEGWLFHSMTSYFLNEEPPSKEDIEKIKSNILARKQWLETRGIKYLIVICPFKTSIYPEYSPYSQFSGFDGTPVDEIIRELKKDERVNLLDLRPVLAESKGEGSLFSPTDFHWNDLGAYVGSRAVMRELQGWFPQIETPPDQGMHLEMQDFPGGELAERLGIEGLYSELKPVYIDSEKDKEDSYYFFFRNKKDGIYLNNNKKSEYPDIMVLHDSFGEKIRPFYSRFADRSIFIWQPRIRKSYVEYFKPDVVIENIVEINLLHLYRSDFHKEKSFIFDHKASHFSFPLRKSVEKVIFKLEPKRKTIGEQFIDVRWNGDYLRTLPLNQQRTLWEIELPKVEPGNQKNADFELVYREKQQAELKPKTAELPFSLQLLTGTKKQPGGKMILNGEVIKTDWGYNLFHIDNKGEILEQHAVDFREGQEKNQEFCRLLTKVTSEGEGYFLLFAHGNVKKGISSESIQSLKKLGAKAKINGRPHQGHYLFYDLSGERIISESWGTQALGFATDDESSQEAFAIYDFQVEYGTTDAEEKGRN